ncbi:MAG: SLC13 family permease, partial [Gammaproteobacteria bacterium]
YLTPLPDVVLQAGDKLVVHDKPESLREYKQVLGGKLYSGDQPVDEDHPLKAEDQQSAEVVISPGSRLEGARLGDARLDTTYNLIVLAIHRAGVEFVSDLQDVVLQAGDVLLVQGSQEDLAQVRNRGELLVLDGSSELPHTKKAPIALGIMAGIVVTAAFGVMPIAVASMAGFVLLLATQCISWRHVGTALNAQIILLIVASLALGKALMRTGGADYLAEVLLFATSGMTPIYVVGAMMLFMALLTNVVSNNAAAVIGTPIAISVAQHLALPYEPFILAVLFGANLSFATPMAYQTNLLVMNAGGYRFNDFVRVGVPLIVMMLIILTVVLVRLYDL